MHPLRCWQVLRGGAVAPAGRAVRGGWTARRAGMALARLARSLPVRVACVPYRVPALPDARAALAPERAAPREQAQRKAAQRDADRRRSYDARGYSSSAGAAGEELLEFGDAAMQFAACGAGVCGATSSVDVVSLLRTDLVLGCRLPVGPGVGTATSC